MSRTFENDLNFGLDNEKDFIPLIEQYIKGEYNILNTKDLYNDEYCYYDFESPLSIFELKSRRNTKHKYPTTIIPKHKIISTTKNHYLIFKFTDKICYIKYDNEKFKTFKTRYIKVNRTDKYDKPTLHYEIPINELIDFF